MDLNLERPIEIELETQVMPALRGMGLKQIDTYAFEIVLERIDFSKVQKFFLTVTPVLLEYNQRREQGGDQTQVWYKCRVQGIEDDDTGNKMDTAAELFKGLFDKLPYKPFYDEDAYLGHFSKGKNRHGDSEVAFYINPAFPEGAWSNHTL